MPRKPDPNAKPPELRSRALTRLNRSGAAGDARAHGAHALRVLYELASCAATSADALVLLHELQVYQVEVELQEEEMRRSREELEDTLARQTARCELAPFGYFTIDGATVVYDINAAGERLLGAVRVALIGRRLDAFLAPDSALVLRAMVARIRAGGARQSGVLHLRLPNGAMRVLHASAGPDRSSDRFLVALFEAGAAAVSGI